MKKNKKFNNIFKANKMFKVMISVFFIISIGAVTSYAYFTRTIGISNDFNFQTGSLIVNLGDNVNEATRSIKVNNMQPGTYGEDTFKIKNNGTLNAKIKLIFNATGLKDKNLLDNFKCILNTKKGSENYRQIKDTFFNFVNHNDGFEFVNDSGTMILKPGEEVDCNFTVYLDDTIDFKYENSKINFSVTVKAIQT